MKKLEIIKQALPIIEVNFDAVKEGLVSQLAKYEKIIVTEETLSDCITMQRELAGVRNKIDGMRMDIQREMKRPLDDFNCQMKELFNLVVATESPIKLGIDVFEVNRKDEKTDEINALMIKAVEPLSEKFAEKIVFNAKWLNKGSKMPGIKDSIDEQVIDLMAMQTAFEETVSAIEEIVTSASEGLTTPLNSTQYINQADEGVPLTKIIISINSASKQRKDAEQAVIDAQNRKAEAVDAEKKELVPVAPVQSEGTQEAPAQSVRTVTIKVTTTDAKMLELSGFMKANYISFEKVAS